MEKEIDTLRIVSNGTKHREDLFSFLDKYGYDYEIKGN